MRVIVAVIAVLCATVSILNGQSLEQLIEEEEHADYVIEYVDVKTTPEFRVVQDLIGTKVRSPDDNKEYLVLGVISAPTSCEVLLLHHKGKVDCVDFMVWRQN